METITINSVEDKFSKTNVPFWSVKYNGNLSATVWDDQIAWYLKQQIGKVCEVSITSKGNYNNIRHVTMTQGNEQPTQAQTPAPTPQETGGLMSVKDIQIVSQCLTKAWVQTTKEPQEVLDAYRFFVKSLEEEG